MRKPVGWIALLCAACGGGPAAPPATAAEAESPERAVERAYLAEAERRDVQMTRLSERLFVRAVTPADVAAYRAEHDDELRALFDANRQRWTDLEPQIHARHILIRATAGEPPQAARIRAEQVRRRILDGEDFAAVAAAESQDPGSAAQGGDLGFFPRGRMVEAFEAAAFALADGAVSEVVPSRFGFHIIRVEGRREGTLSYEEVVPELAERGARNSLRREAMLAAADDVVERVAGGATLEQALAAALPERTPPTTERAAYRGVPWPFRPEVQEHVAEEEPPGERWVEALEADREVIVLVVTRHLPDPTTPPPAVAACLRARLAQPACDGGYEAGPCDACAPEVQRALEGARAAPPARRAPGAALRQHRVASIAAGR